MTLLNELGDSEHPTAAWETIQRKGRAGGVDGVGVETFARRVPQRLLALQRQLRAAR